MPSLRLASGAPIHPYTGRENLLRPMIAFASPRQRQQAEQLMQPTLIRVIDNLRKALETSGWRGSYHEHPLWPPGTTAAEQERVQQLQRQLSTAAPEAVPALQAELNLLPQPFPGYELHLYRDDAPPVQIIDIWELCYRVCLDRYHPEVPARVDTSLLEADGEIDWLALDTKAKGLIQQIFQQLPASGSAATETPGTEAPGDP